MKDVNQCHKIFLEYRKIFDTLLEEKLTESDTRSKIIDKVFLDILDWTDDSINREGYIRAGYYDYLFSIPGFKFIVEAKKTSIRFIIPNNNKSITLGTFEKSNKDVVDQIRHYLFEKGLQYAILTNGDQFIIGKFANNDGNDWRNNKCLIFNGLDEINDNFIEFYNVLSKNSMTENYGFKYYLEDAILDKGRTILSSLPSNDSEIVRNSLSSELTPIINFLFGELSDIDDTINTELLKECFIENKETKKNKSEIERLFADNPPRVENIIPAINTESIVNQIANELSNDNLKLNSKAPQPIVIVGSKGAGKTTFIKYLFSNNSISTIEKEHPYVYIDFRNYSSIQNGFESKIFADILEQIYDRYNYLELTQSIALKSIYNKEIKRYNESIWKDDLDSKSEKYQEKLNIFLEKQISNNENHFYKLSEHLIAKRRIRLCIVIDNADQYEFSVQKNVFLFAQSLNRKGNATIIISLREGYYYKCRYLPPFDAFPSNVYHITAPPYNEVLSKRIDYALKHITLKGTTKGDIDNNKVLVLSNDSVRKFLLSLKTSLFRNEDSEMLKFIQETTYPNIRDGLEVFKQFLISGHTEVHEYVLRQETNPDSKQPIPFWEFIKAVALNNKKYYNHNISVINNLFYPSEGSRNLFLKIKILKFLDNKLVRGGSTEKYINVDELIEPFVNAGYSKKIVRKELLDLSRYRLIETETQVSDIDDYPDLVSDSSICLSLKGHHYVNSLLSNFSYIELVLQDTPIFDADKFSLIKSNFPLANEFGKRSLQGRVKVVEMFIEYLENEEKSETVESELLAKKITQDIKNGVYKDITRIQKKLSTP